MVAEIKLLQNWPFAAKNNFIWSPYKEIRLRIGSNKYVLGSFGVMTVSHTNKIPISLILVILGPKAKFSFVDVPEDSRRHSQEV